ncbi:MAG: SlyX family protein [Candidatus Endonucleobacter bathymodioli]|uniref:SlyX family protein n=1 Tax=Candidatus Endonucleibacter bathymodioli TaxID=539814 RepID=A0AA90NW40_9GAMM|nr:SlyX family protein [Candidatus Endonucleobacter bathymodioli]
MNYDHIELQTQLSFQENTVAQLNKVVTQHQQDIVELLAKVKQLQELYYSLAVNIKPDNQKNEVPPHY